MTHLQTDPNFADPQARYLNAYSPGDDFYEFLIKAHEDELSQGARLIKREIEKKQAAAVAV